MSAESLAATTEVDAPIPDGNEPEPKSAESAPAVTDTGEDAATRVNKKTTDGLSSRIDELTRNWREEQRRSASLMQLLERDRGEARTPAPEPEPSSTAGKTLADFGYDEGKFQSHLFAEARKEAVKAAKEELTRDQEKSTADALEATFSEHEAKFSKDLADYMEVTRSQSLTISATMAQVTKEAGAIGPQILYHLAKNPTLAASIARLPPLQQAREIGRIEAKLAEKPPVPKVSAAPPPAPKLDASDAKVSKDPADMNATEWAAWRKKYQRK